MLEQYCIACVIASALMPLSAANPVSPRDITEKVSLPIGTARVTVVPHPTTLMSMMIMRIFTGDLPNSCMSVPFRPAPLAARRSAVRVRGLWLLAELLHKVSYGKQWRQLEEL